MSTSATFARVLGWLISALIGTLFGAAGTFSHMAMLGQVPIGMVVGMIGCAAILVAIRVMAQDRWAAVAAGLGMIVAVVVLSGRGPGGSVVVTDGVLGQVWTAGVGLVILLVAAWPRLHPARDA